MKKTLMVVLLSVSMPILAPSMLAAVLAASLSAVPNGGGQAGQGGTVGTGAGRCALGALEIPTAAADTSAVQYAGTEGCGAPGAPAPYGSSGLAALAYAEAQIGTPYQWGAERAGFGFDCSGLAQAAWRAAGVSLPRVAQAQFDQGPAVPEGEALEPGDLVFFGGGAEDVTHVGIVMDGAGEMVDAPHTGALVRTDPFPIIPGSRWGGEVFVGATRPGGAT